MSNKRQQHEVCANYGLWLRSTASSLHQWWRGYDLIAIGFITIALLMAGIAIEAATGDQNAQATEVLQQR